MTQKLLKALLKRQDRIDAAVFKKYEQEIRLLNLINAISSAK